MPTIHDPYLDTVRRSLNDEKIKSRKEKIEKINTTQKSFLSQSVNLSDYIYLPEELEKLFFLAIFIIIPYIFGLFILLVIMELEEFKEFIQFKFDIFLLTWTVGYECIAILLLLAIVKSAFTFTKKEN